MKTLSDNPVIAITGANGFIGKHLVNTLSEFKNISLRLLVRNKSNSPDLGSNVTYVQGDLTDKSSLSGFLEPACTVINLAYSPSDTSERNIKIISNLIDICKNNKVKRVIHCSTAAVYGHAGFDSVNEITQCNAKSDYGTTKLKIENMFFSESRGFFEFVNIRPTAVYGADGQALMKLINNLVNGNSIINYLRLCLFNTRSLNLVHVSNVVAAICFLVDIDEKVDSETFIVSEDFEPNNNYQYVENFLRHRLRNTRNSLPPFSLPLVFLSWLLRLRGRDLINPMMTYDSEKLKNIGFKYEISLDEGLNDLCDWYNNNSIHSGKD